MRLRSPPLVALSAPPRNHKDSHLLSNRGRKLTLAEICKHQKMAGSALGVKPDKALAIYADLASNVITINVAEDVSIVIVKTTPPHRGLQHI